MKLSSINSKKNFKDKFGVLWIEFKPGLFCPEDKLWKQINEIKSKGDRKMGSTWEVEVWKRCEWRGDEEDFVQVWRGEHWWEAIWNYIKAKREGYICVVLYWRSSTKK